VACGTARYIPTLSEIKDVRYLGIDTSSIHVSRNIRDYPNMQFILADGLQPGTIPNCDVIIASHFIEHIEDPLQFLLKIKSLCRKIIIEVPDFSSDPINAVSFHVNAPWWTDRDHQREFSEETLGALLAKAGYKFLDRKLFGGTLAVVAFPIF
jgi:SAM-dependent methyltransferase